MPKMTACSELSIIPGVLLDMMLADIGFGVGFSIVNLINYGV